MSENSSRRATIRDWLVRKLAPHEDPSHGFTPGVLDVLAAAIDEDFEGLCAAVGDRVEERVRVPRPLEVEPWKPTDGDRWRDISDGGSQLMEWSAELNAWCAVEEGQLEDLISWAEQRYEDEVRDRPDGNVHKPVLHNTWTQVISKLREVAGN